MTCTLTTSYDETLHYGDMEGIHSLSDHLNYIHSLCRVCCERKTRSDYKDKDATGKCCDFSDELSVCGIVESANENQEKYSNGICRKCKQSLFRVRKITKSEQKSSETVKALASKIESSCNLWTVFDPKIAVSECSSCSHFLKQRTGGRPKKKVVVEIQT